MINNVASNEILFNAIRACLAVTVLSVFMMISNSSSKNLQFDGLRRQSFEKVFGYDLDDDILRGQKYFLSCYDGISR